MKSFILLLTLATPVFAQEFKVKDIPQEVIEFKREYSAQTFIHGVPIKVEIDAKFAKDYVCDKNYNCAYKVVRQLSGIVVQYPDSDKEAMIAYQVLTPADKIIDRDVLGFVYLVTNEARHRDAAYVKQGLTEFRDESGSHWRKF